MTLGFLYWFRPPVLRPVPKLLFGFSLNNTLASPGGTGSQLLDLRATSLPTWFRGLQAYPLDFTGYKLTHTGQLQEFDFWLCSSFNTDLPTIEYTLPIILSSSIWIECEDLKEVSCLLNQNMRSIIKDSISNLNLGAFRMQEYLESKIRN